MKSLQRTASGKSWAAGTPTSHQSYHSKYLWDESTSSQLDHIAKTLQELGQIFGQVDLSQNDQSRLFFCTARCWQLETALRSGQFHGKLVLRVVEGLDLGYAAAHCLTMWYHVAMSTETAASIPYLTSKTFSWSEEGICLVTQLSSFANAEDQRWSPMKHLPMLQCFCYFMSRGQTPTNTDVINASLYVTL